MCLYFNNSKAHIAYIYSKFTQLTPPIAMTTNIIKEVFLFFQMP